METHATKFPAHNYHADDDRDDSDLLRAELLSFLNASTLEKITVNHGISKSKEISQIHQGLPKVEFSEWFRTTKHNKIS